MARASLESSSTSTLLSASKPCRTKPVEVRSPEEVSRRHESRIPDRHELEQPNAALTALFQVSRARVYLPVLLVGSALLGCVLSELALIWGIRGSRERPRSLRRRARRRPEGRRQPKRADPT